MTVYVLDSSALLRYIDNEAGADRIEGILIDCVAGRAKVCISAVQWGEVAGNLRKRLGALQERRILSNLLPSESEIVDAGAERAVRAAEIKVDRKIAYADAFALDLAIESADHVLVTADYGFKAVDDLARIEFLPAR
ncbi:MAG: PIN domain-containing protein [Terracidiphilus sp.]|jgi:predicted nucleic acid-binding protein